MSYDTFNPWGRLCFESEHNFKTCHNRKPVKPPSSSDEQDSYFCPETVRKSKTEVAFLLEKQRKSGIRACKDRIFQYILPADCPKIAVRRLSGTAVHGEGNQRRTDLCCRATGGFWAKIPSDHQAGWSNSVRVIPGTSLTSSADHRPAPAKPGTTASSETRLWPSP